MRICFLAPLNMSGGALVIALYAQRLQARGHEVVICPGWRQYLFRPESHFAHRGLKLRPTAPDGDVVIATWWGTAAYVFKLPERKGAKFYFIQHHEIHSYLPENEVRATYRLPLRKIAVARWLADVMREEYGSDCAVVPNSVEHDRFFAPPRGKQDLPTVGFLCSSAPWKGVWIVIAALQELKRKIPNLQARCFGLEHPGPLPSFISFTLSPAQTSIRDIYASCDVWLTASRSEGFNLPAMEAMACRTPVVATRTGWPAESIVSGTNGFLVDVDDAEGMISATERVLKMTDLEWRNLSDAAYATVRDSSWDKSTALFENVLVEGSRAALARDSKAAWPRASR
jgi:glycosyltransferase involved in cell wall biosynthesis